MHERELLMAVVGIAGIAWSGALLIERAIARQGQEDEARVVEPRRRWGFSRAGHLAGLLALIATLIGLGLDLSRLHLAQLLMCVVVGIVVVQQFIARLRTRAARAALRLAAVGNITGAVEDVRKQITLRGPSADRYNTLGVLFGLQGEWEEAARALEAAEHFGDGDPQLRGNRGVALWKLGRHQDALPLLADAFHGEPDNFTSACHYCLVLAETGHLDEAARVRRRVEYLYRRQWLFSAADRSTRRWLLHQCRRQASSRTVSDR